MTDFLDLFAGNPRSPSFQPDLIEIARALNELAASAGLSGRSYFRNNLAGLNAVTDEVAGDAGFVLNDSEANKGVYSTDGTTWTKVSELPPGFAAFSLADVAESGNSDDLIQGVTNLLMTAAERNKLSGVATGATANSTDAQLRERGSHTGEQAIATVSGLADSLGPARVALTDAEGRVPLLLSGGQYLLWAMVQEGRAASLTGAFEFENLRAAVSDAEGNLPIIGAGDRALAFARDGQVFTPVADDAPEVFVSLVNGVDQAFIVFPDVGSYQLTFAQEDVRSVRLDAPDNARYVAGAATVARAPFYPVPLVILPPDTWVHVTGGGQSLSIGYATGGSVLTEHDAAPDLVRMFNGGVVPIQVAPTKANNTTALDPAQISSLVGANEAAKGTTFFETHLTAMGWSLAGPAGLGAQAPVTVSGHGFGASTYAEIGPGTSSWNNMLSAVQAHADLAAAASATAFVPWFDWVHGEDNSADSKVTYLAHLNEIEDEANIDIRAITGQTKPVLVVVDQMAKLAGGRVSEVALAQLEFGKTNTNGVCAGPKYWGEFGDSVHMVSDQYPVIGEYHAKFALERMQGRPALPLHMTGVSRLNVRQLLITFHVPVPPLQIGGMGLITDPGNAGIQVFQLGAEIAISKVALSGGGQIVVTLSTDITTTDPVRVDIAMQNLTPQGKASGPRSTIHDSDRRIGPVTGRRLVNWACHDSITIS